MFSTIKTLVRGANARAEDRLKDEFALELIDQKIRETEAQHQAAKTTLASLIQRQRSEQRQFDALQNRIEKLTDQAKAALKAERAELVTEAASAIAEMENEARLRRTTLDRLEQQALRLRSSLDASQRRIIDLKQGAITAKAIRREQKIQSRLNTTLTGQSSADEAQELITRVTGGDDPLEQAQILQEIDAGLTHAGLSERMAAEGFGNADKTTAADVLARLSK